MDEQYQSDYKAKHSRETTLLKVQLDIAPALDDNCVVMLVMLDLSTVFDSVDQEKLMFMFECQYGIQGRALSWFRSYHVQIDGASSECVPLWCGVPKGSVLGPTLFTMYTAPINRILQRHMVLATTGDDIPIYVSFNPNTESDKERSMRHLVTCIREIRKWTLLHR